MYLGNSPSAPKHWTKWAVPCFCRASAVGHGEKLSHCEEWQCDALQEHLKENLHSSVQKAFWRRQPSRNPKEETGRKTKLGQGTFPLARSAKKTRSLGRGSKRNLCGQRVASRWETGIESCWQGSVLRICSGSSLGRPQGHGAWLVRVDKPLGKCCKLRASLLQTWI